MPKWQVSDLLGEGGDLDTNHSFDGVSDYRRFADDKVGQRLDYRITLLLQCLP